MRQFDFQTVGAVPDDRLKSNIAYSTLLNLPLPKATARKLAVVGGGESAAASRSEIQNWDGEVWGINGAAHWCNENGIPATLYSISPQPHNDRYLKGITRAILSFECDPGLFQALSGHEVYTFDRDGYGPTSACAATALALKAGFSEVSFFGCEGNYANRTHVYQNSPSDGDMLVRIAGQDFRTNVGFFIQTQTLGYLIAGAPHYCKDCSGGMLSALIANPAGWDVIKSPSEMKDAA